MSSSPPRQTVEYGKKQVQIFSSTEDLQAALGPYISSIANNAVKSRGKFTIAFSGGSLPAIVGAALSSPSESSTISTSIPHWHIFFADERLVPLSDPESNYAAVHKTFLSHFPFPPSSIHPINTQLLPSPHTVASAYQTDLLSITPDGVFDLILLGMGPDGHTASLFPSHPLLKETHLLIAPITDSPKPPPERVTMTLPLINRARHVVFVVTGDKAEALHGALEVPEKELPAGMVEGENTAFFVDQKAAGKLTKAKL